MPRANPNSSTEKEMVALAEEELARLQRQVRFYPNFLFNNTFYT